MEITDQTWFRNISHGETMMFNKKWFKFTVFACWSVSYKVLWVWQTQVCDACPATLLWKMEGKVKMVNLAK